MQSIDKEKWEIIKAIFKSAGKSSKHYAFATVDKDGLPHVTPVASLILEEDSNGFYFEENIANMVRNFEHSRKVCVLAVNSSRWYWLKSLVLGKAKMPISVRLLGTAGEKRKATPEEMAKWQKRIRRYKWTKGYNLLWKNHKNVREIHFESFEPVKIRNIKSRIEI